jgi:hypothetical protein
MAAMTPMIPTTSMSSMRVNPRRLSNRILDSERERESGVEGRRAALHSFDRGN